MHIITAMHGHPANFEIFQKWINSLNYGSRPYYRELRIGDIQIREELKEKLLADIMNYYNPNKSGVGSLRPFLKLIMKPLKLKPVDMLGIKPTGKKIPGIKGGFYLCPLGSWEDRMNYLNQELI
jgi:hypothetical protein